MSMTGRRPNERLRNIGKGFLEGLSAVGTAMADGPKFARINEIDNEIERLQHEKDSLIVGLIEPGNLKVSDDYDPNKAVIMNLKPGTTRLAECDGRSTYGIHHTAHPACPYIRDLHGKHDFTLRD